MNPRPLPRPVAGRILPPPSGATGSDRDESTPRTGSPIRRALGLLVAVGVLGLVGVATVAGAGETAPTPRPVVVRS